MNEPKPPASWDIIAVVLGVVLILGAMAFSVWNALPAK